MNPLEGVLIYWSLTTWKNISSVKLSTWIQIFSLSRFYCTLTLGYTLWPKRRGAPSATPCRVRLIGASLVVSLLFTIQEALNQFCNANQDFAAVNIWISEARFRVWHAWKSIDTAEFKTIQVSVHRSSSSSRILTKFCGDLKFSTEFCV
jgi:hypothetical protein